MATDTALGFEWQVTAVDADTRWVHEGDIAIAHVDLDSVDGGRWPAVQPGIHDADGGFRAHRIIASFTTADARSATLRLEFSVERGPCPDLEIVIDGIHRGIFHPTVHRSDRSGTGEPGPIAGLSGLEIPIPDFWLPAGRHTVSVTTVLDEASALGDRGTNSHDVSYRPTENLPPARGHYGNWFGSYIRWSRISLAASSELQSSELQSSATLALRPTPFYVGTGDEVRELIDLDIMWPAGSSAPTGIVLDWDGTELVVPSVPADRQFGHFRWRFVAPPFETATTARLISGGTTIEFPIAPARKWDLHLIPHVHLDLGFTDAQGKVLELHCRNIDRALDLMDTDPDFRYSVDGSFVVREYVRTRSGIRVARMRDAIRRGTLGVNAFHSNLLTGVVSLEELYRSTDYAQTLPRSSRTNLRYANLTDVPTCTSAVPAVLAHLGIDGFVGMANHGRAATKSSDELHLLSPVRWRGPDGSEVLAHFADHYSQLRFVAGDPQDVSAAANGLDRFVARFDRDDYIPTDLAVIGTHADNEDLADGDTGFVSRWNAEFAYPRFRVSTFDEYLAAVAPLSDRLPLWRGETGSYWEDGVGSAAAEFAVYRRTQAVLPAAETLGAAVSASDGIYRVNRAELDRAWQGLSIAAEHTLTWARSTSHPHAFPVADQLGWKIRFIEDSGRVAVDEMRRHLAQLAEVIGAVGPGYLAYNPHAWTADLEGEIDLLDGINLMDGRGVLDVETLRSCAGMRRCRVLVAGMAPHSYRFLPMTAALDTLPGGEVASRRTSAPSAGGPSYSDHSPRTPIETAGWTVELDSETLLPRSLRHRASGRELLDQDTRLGLGQLVRTAAAPAPDTESNSMLGYGQMHEHDRTRIDYLGDFATTTSRVDLLSESPTLAFRGTKTTFDGVRIRWEGRGAGLESIAVELLLRNESDTCDLDVTFTKTPCLDMEAVYVAFPFAGGDPVLRYDRQLGWVEPAVDHGPGASNEWGALTNTVSLQTTDGETLWTALDAPLFTAGDVVRGVWPDHFTSRNGHLFSYLMNNFWPCNTPPAQQGEVSFRYRFGLYTAFDPARSTRFGRVARVGAQLAEITPLERFRAGAAPAYLEGQLLDLGADGNTDVQVRQGTDEDRMYLLVTNLVADARAIDLRLPHGMRFEVEDVSEQEIRAIESTENGVRVRIGSFGVVHVPLRRS